MGFTSTKANHRNGCQGLTHFHGSCLRFLHKQEGWLRIGILLVLFLASRCLTERPFWWAQRKRIIWGAASSLADLPGFAVLHRHVCFCLINWEEYSIVLPTPSSRQEEDRALLSLACVFHDWAKDQFLIPSNNETWGLLFLGLCWQPRFLCFPPCLFPPVDGSWWWVFSYFWVKKSP